MNRRRIVIDLATGSISYVIAARFSAYIVEDRVEYGSAYSLEEQEARAIVYKQLPKRRYFVETCWTQIADEIEKRLSRG